MTEKFQNRYRIPSARATWHDYNGGEYFITICTKNREHYFGEIIRSQCNASANKMQLSPIGEIAKTEWLKTFEMRRDMNLIQGAFVVMPNHFHAIIIIGENKYNTGTDTKNKFGSQSKNLASIVRGFKSAVTKFATENNIEFAWQTRFHDHIIRDSNEMNRITDYINNNVKQWQSDSFYDNSIK